MIEKDLGSYDALFEINIGLNSDLTKINRKTGSLLDLLGTCGGLLRALTVLGSVLVNPYTLYALKSKIA